jgi:DNA-binding NtrC family response regulator
MNKRILVIDDESPLCELLKEIIEQENEGRFQVDFATQFDEAMEKMQAAAYDLVFLDIKLSESRSGIDILKKCKELNLQAKFVIYSALGKDLQWPVLERAKVDGMVLDYLEKNNNLSLDEFMQWVRKFADQQPGSPKS